ncbi:unnamed protein product [Adineta steineri]|uniref:Diacylglycerol O-acyltransferase n=1 Tax=Adineta steineri TaxID=433720 RepID=A0A813YSW7_9BILA|nr:unnamed protein product [Adineta steineri]CAF3510557.1 unnamed protein product [Adineta steineri]
MQVDTRWVQPVVSDLASAPYDGNNYQHNIEQNLSVQSPPLSKLQPPLIATIFFPSPRVEPIDMARSHQQTTQNRSKTGYTQSATTDEQRHVTAPYLENRPIKRVKHPADRSPIIFIVQRISSACLTIFISLPCVILLTLLLPICWFIRTLIRLACRHHCNVTPCACSYLSASDLFWFYNSNISSNREKNDETTKLNSQTISPTAAAIFFLEGTINENSLKKLLINRLVTSSVRRGSNIGKKLFPRFSQLVVSRLSGAMWVDYSLFSIDEHVREIPRTIQSDEDLQSYISTLLSTELTRSRPLWQLHYKNRSSTRPNDSIIVFFYHPVLSDGISLLRILLKHIVDNRTTQLDLKPRFVGRHNEYIFDYIKAYLFGHMLIFSKLLFNSFRENFFKRKLLKTNINNNNNNHNNVNNNNNISTINSHFLQPQEQRKIVWSAPFSLTQANRMKLVTRTRMNDLLSTLVISSVRLYMERYGVSNSVNMNCIMPCDLRSNSANIIMGNQISHLCFELPMNIEGNIPLLWSFYDSTKRVKENGDYATMYLFTHIVYLLFPLCLANKIIARIYNSASLWLTTLAAGSSTALATMSICNRDVRSLICLSPCIGTASVNLCVTTYADEIRLVVIADPNVVPNLHLFTEYFSQQLTIVQDLLAHRRIPGEIRRITRPPRSQPAKKSISSISDLSDDLSIEEIQAKMTALQQELLSLKSQFENVDMNDPSSQTQRLIITTKLEELRREFRELLIKLQERQCELSGMIPSDEEDEMDPHVRVRLRSASVASKISLRSNDQRLLSAKMYQLDRDEGSSEFSASIVPSNPSASKMSLTAQQFNDQQIGIRRAQSVSICENTQIDMQSRTVLNRTRLTTPTRVVNTTTNTILHLDPSENWKNASGN